MKRARRVSTSSAAPLDPLDEDTASEFGHASSSPVPGVSSARHERTLSEMARSYSAPGSSRDVTRDRARFASPPLHSLSKSPPAVNSPSTSSSSGRSRSVTPDVFDAQLTIGSDHLVMDLKQSKSRLLLTKTQVHYRKPTAAIPFPFCVLGLQIIYHSLAPPSRIKAASICVRLLPRDNSTLHPPIIKSIYPGAQSVSSSSATQVVRTSITTAGCSFGFDPYGAIDLNFSRQAETHYTTQTSALGSGVETNTAVFSFCEDPNAKKGVDTVHDIALLLQLPDLHDMSFQAEIKLEASISHGGPTERIRHFVDGPTVRQLAFDGVSEMGVLQFRDVVRHGQAERLLRQQIAMEID